MTDHSYLSSSLRIIATIRRGNNEANTADVVDSAADTIDMADTLVSELIAEVVRWREAARPFANLLDPSLEGRDDGFPVWGINDRVFTLGQLRTLNALFDSEDQ